MLERTAFSLVRFLLAIAGMGLSTSAFASGPDKSNACFFEDKAAIAAQELRISSIIPEKIPEDIVVAGGLIFESFPEADQGGIIDSAKRRMRTTKNAYSLEAGLIDDVFSKYKSSCSDATLEYLDRSMMDWVVSAVSRRWGVHENGFRCEGFCDELGKNGIVNLSDRMKIAFLAYVYVRVSQQEEIRRAYDTPP